MADRNFDFSELDRLAADLGDVPAGTEENIEAAITISSRKVEGAWRGKLRGSETLPGLPNAVTFDVTRFTGFGVSLFQSEIGFDKSIRQGPLGNISEFGSINNPPRGFGHAALQENEADFQHGLEIAIGDALKAAGL